MSMPSTVRHINEIRVLEVVLRHGRISRANIARELSLTRSTASSIVAGLAADGLIVEDVSGDDRGAGTGRPGTFVRLNASHALFVGAEIGVGNLDVVALDLEATVVARARADFPVGEADAERVVERVAALAAEVAGRFEGSHRMRGLCLALPGVVDRRGNLVRAPLLGWRDVPVLERLGALLPDVPMVVCENDANAFAAAHSRSDEKSGTASEIYLFLDAGVGGAIMNGGRLLRGHDGYAGEFGHIVMADEGYRKLSTPAGTFESLVGRDAVLGRFRHHGGRHGTDFAGFLEAVGDGDAAAAATVGDWAFYMGRGLALITSVFNPSRIVLGGQVAALFTSCGEAVLSALRSNLLEDQPIPSVELSGLGQGAPALGGALILHRRMFSLDEELVFRRGGPGPLPRPWHGETAPAAE